MDFELRRAREKLAKEQKERKESARRKLEKERKAKEEAKKQREAIDAERSRRLFDAAQAQLKVDQQMQESLLVERGIMFYCVFEAVRCQGRGCQLPASTNCKIKVVIPVLLVVSVYYSEPSYLRSHITQGSGSSMPYMYIPTSISTRSLGSSLASGFIGTPKLSE